VVRAELPHYVRWVGMTLPANEQVLYNKERNTLEWHLGTVKSGTGVHVPARMVTFAVGLVPSATQIGKAPALLKNQVFTAQDSYTGIDIETEIDDIDTRTVHDVQYHADESRVVK